MNTLSMMLDADDALVQEQLSEAGKLSRWAAVAQGFVKVDLDRRPVQHAEGGKVTEEINFLGAQIEQASQSLRHQKTDLEINRNLLKTRPAAR